MTTKEAATLFSLPRQTLALFSSRSPIATASFVVVFAALFFFTTMPQ
jgi:hypothetical protein